MKFNNTHYNFIDLRIKGETIECSSLQELIICVYELSLFSNIPKEKCMKIGDIKDIYSKYKNKSGKVYVTTDMQFYTFGVGKKFEDVIKENS